MCRHAIVSIRNLFTRKAKSGVIALGFIFCLARSFAQDSLYTNSIGMEFVLIKPGNFIVGRFQPPYPKPSDKKEGNPSERGYNAEEYFLADSLANRDTSPG